jgi:hypothetical protein
MLLSICISHLLLLSYFDQWKLALISSPYKPELSMIRSCPDRLEFKNECYSTVNQINSYIRLNKILNIVILLVYVDTKYQI